MQPHDIERESFRIIRHELGAHHFTEQELSIVVRVIHATADFEFRDRIRFHPCAIVSGIEALRRGCAIVTDVQMVQAGIGDGMLSFLGGKMVCDIRHPDVRDASQQSGLTRSALALRRNAALIHQGIAAIGNAPTALLEMIRLVKEADIRPALIVGVPVGFVNAVESKDELLKLDVPYITSTGRKGGSTVAVAVINALLRMAKGDD